MLSTRHRLVTRRLPLGVAVSCSLALAACSSSKGTSTSEDAGVHPSDAATDGPSTSGDSGPTLFCDGGTCTSSKIQHIVVLIQENHTFDAYFGSYCQADAGSNPTCTTGPTCCEAIPAAPPQMDGGPAQALSDSSNRAYDRTHLKACELEEINDGGMDKYVSAPSVPQNQDGGGGTSACGDPRNIAVVPASTNGGSVIQAYLGYAAGGTLADRYFQPSAGQSSQNDMYFAAAKFEFQDNSEIPNGIAGTCVQNPLNPATPVSLTDPNIGDLLNDAGVSWSFYSGGYAAAVASEAANGECPQPDPSCPSGETLPTFDCIYNAGDNPFAFYASTRDDPNHAKDFTDFATDLSGGTLPSVAYVKMLEAFTEHPGYGQTISDGVTYVSQTIAAIQASPFADSTLIVLTWDEGGGFYDHVSPPPTNSVDGQPYGTRLPAIFIGPFAKSNAITHTVMEHSSLVKFIEYNWLHATGQLGNRDTNVNNIGSALDPTATGVAVPE